MASNVRGDRVVHPNHVAEYDRLANSGITQQILMPAAIVAGAGVLFGYSSGSTVWLAVGLLLGSGALITGICMSFSAMKKARKRMMQISWDLRPMRAATTIDEQTISNNALWIAAQRDYSKIMKLADEPDDKPSEESPEQQTPTEAIDQVVDGLSELL